MYQSATQLLDQQLDLLDQQSDPERWKVDHEIAMLCGDAEDLIALALETLDRIKRRRRDSLPDETVLAYFRRWHGISLRALACIEWIEERGTRPERADEFRFAINAASMANDADRIIAVYQRLEAGQGRTLDEILNELSPQT